MKSPGNRQKVIMISISLITVLLAIGLISILSKDLNNHKMQILPSPESTPSMETDLEPDTPSPEPNPGLIVYGMVHDAAGSGIKNVQIYRSYASYPGMVIATTDANGYYESDFYLIPGDEMVSIWAEKQGFIFEPEDYSYRHYYGYERKECNFIAQP